MTVTPPIHPIQDSRSKVEDLQVTPDVMGPDADEPRGRRGATRAHGAIRVRFSLFALRSSTRLRLGLALAALLLVAAAPARGAVDPFYENLLRKGTDAFNRRDFPTAARLLRLASFGMLEDPVLLADSLTRLALAQAAAGDADGFRQTFDRLTEIEQRFGAYSAAEIPADARAALQRNAAQLVPAVTLRASPLFQDALDPRVAEIAAQPAARRRASLEKLVKNEPTQVSWRLLLARLDLDEGNADAALKQAEAALHVSPGNAQALLVRGLADAALARWSQAIADLAGSGRTGADPAAARALLQSYVALERWDDARSFLAGLSVAMAGRPDIASLAAKVPAP